MSFLETLGTRRNFLMWAGKVAIAAPFTASLSDQSPIVNPKDFEYARDYNSVNGHSVDGVIVNLREKTKGFTRFIRNEKDLPKFSPKSEPEELTDNVKLGSLLAANPSLIPINQVLVCHMRDNNIAYYPATNTSYKLNNREHNPQLKYFLARFPGHLVLRNQEFIVLFSARLFNVSGKELPSFILPYRFIIEREIPPDLKTSGDEDDE